MSPEMSTSNDTGLPAERADSTFFSPLLPVEYELEIKRSRFLCVLHPTADKQAARDVIAMVRKQHPKARHHCTAFVLGGTSQTMSSNDDGEPSGTAGTPILETLVAAKVSQATAVVVRYFGGVLLGAGGLTRAYREATAGAVAAAELVRFEPRRIMVVTTSYPTAALIEARAHHHDWTVLASEYADTVTLTLSTGVGSEHATRNALQELSSGEAQIVEGERRHLPRT